MKISKKLYLSILGLALLTQGCKKIEQGLDRKDIQYLSVQLKANSLVEELTSTSGLTVVFENFAEGLRIEQNLNDGFNRIDSLIPGTYSINITGRLEGASNDYILNGSKTNYLLIADQEQVEIDVNGATVGPLAFSEIFYAGTSPFYFRNQFYEIINNSDETVYLDGLYFANLTPGAATTQLSIWPEEDAGRYTYAERIWQIPGNGTEYPLAPGESFSMAQFAANHKLPAYSPNSPIDCSTSEFEFNMDDANFPDQPATDMRHIFYNGKAAKGSLPMYLTSVFGGAYVIFRVPQGESYNPADDLTLQTRDLGTTKVALFAKIPIKYIVDAIECGNNANSITGKRIPSVLDAGMTYVGATYNSLGVRRKKIGTRPNGSPILDDTNNSSNDLERGVTPTFRYYEAAIPAWSSAQ